MNEQQVNTAHAEQMEGLLVLGSALSRDLDPILQEWMRKWVQENDEAALAAVSARIRAAFVLLHEIERFAGFIAGADQLKGARP